MHPRAIAKILNKNSNLNKYPCYKVIHSNGKVGGYKLGQDEKIKRLKGEGIEIKNGKISPKYIIFK